MWKAGLETLNKKVGIGLSFPEEKYFQKVSYMETLLLMGWPHCQYFSMGLIITSWVSELSLLMTRIHTIHFFTFLLPPHFQLHSSTIYKRGMVRRFTSRKKKKSFKNVLLLTRVKLWPCHWCSQWWKILSCSKILSHHLKNIYLALSFLIVPSQN